MSNTEENRYGGADCCIMLVSQGVGIGTTDITTIVYEDKDGNTVTTTIRTKHDVPAATLLTAADAVDPGALGFASPYIACPNGCKRILSFDFNTGVGGIFAAVIVKILGTVSILEPLATGAGAPMEIDYFRDRMRFTEIADGSYIGMIYRATTSATPTNLMAELSFIWS